MDKIRLRIPTTQYGFIEIEKDFALEKKEELYKEAIDDFKYLVGLWKAPQGTNSTPEYLGQEIKDSFGHTYKAVQNEGSDKLYWLIDK